MRTPIHFAQHLTGLRLLLVFTVVLGLGYPLLILGIAQFPGLRSRADGHLVSADGRVVGSAIIGQPFTDSGGKPLPQYLQSRPSAAGDGYDPTSTGASNLGPESVVDTLGDDGSLSLLSQVCARSMAVGRLEGVSGARPFCTADGVGAVLAVYRRDGATGPVTRAVSVNQTCPATPFLPSYEGVRVECAEPGKDLAGGVITPIRGAASTPTVPADAVTASGSGLDYQISPAYAALQAPRIARIRTVPLAEVERLIAEHTTGRSLGFLGEPGVNVLELNLALDRQYPYRGGH